MTPSPSRGYVRILTPHAALSWSAKSRSAMTSPLHLHCHATTGMAEMALLKAIEAGPTLAWRRDGPAKRHLRRPAVSRRWSPPSPARRTTPG
ncbi:hypothetical protein MJ575_04805 [Klebsiella pneumoniae]|nr:hypothetical protein MJ575_04805 [Klebsiella pneumoniae]